MYMNEVSRVSRSRKPVIVDAVEYKQALNEMYAKTQYILETIMTLVEKPAVAMPARRDLNTLLKDLTVVENRIVRLSKRVRRPRATPYTEEERRARRIERAKELLRREAGIEIPD